MYACTYARQVACKSCVKIMLQFTKNKISFTHPNHSAEDASSDELPIKHDPIK